MTRAPDALERISEALSQGLMNDHTLAHGTLSVLLDIAESLRVLAERAKPAHEHLWTDPDDRHRQTCRGCGLVRLITEDVDTSAIGGTNGSGET